MSYQQRPLGSGSSHRDHQAGARQGVRCGERRSHHSREEWYAIYLAAGNILP